MASDLKKDVPCNRLKFDMEGTILNLVSKDPTKLPQIDLIKQLFATIDHTPDHPVYPVMIQEAITDLNEEGGSTKDAISKFIVRKYDVVQVVHQAKLIEQLDKLVKKQEIVCTSENRYMLPVEVLEDPGSPVRLKQGKKQLEQCELDQTSNKRCKVNRGYQIESSAKKSGLQEQTIVIKTQRPEVMEKVLQKEQQMQRQTRILEGFHNDELDRPPEFQIEGFENQNHLREEQVKVSEEQGLQITGKLFSQVNEVRQEKIEEKRCGQHTKGVDDQRNVEEIQDPMRETEATEEQSQLQSQALNVIEDQVETGCQIKVTEELCNVEYPERESVEIKGRTQPQVQRSLHVDEHSQLEENHTEAINTHCKTHRQEVEVTEKQKGLQESYNVVEVIETEVCAQHVEGVDDQRYVEEIQAHIGGTEATKEQCQLQRQALDVLKDQVAAERQIEVTAELCIAEHLVSGNIKGESHSQVQQSLHIEEHSQLQQNHVEAINFQSKTQGQEVELTKEQKCLQEQHDEVANKATDFNNMSELFIRKPDQDEAIILTTSCQKLDHVGPLLPSHAFKEKLMGLWKRIRGTEQELKEVISCLSAMEVLKHNGPRQMVEEVQIVPESEPRSISHSVYLATDSMQHVQSWRIKPSNLKRTREIEITALEESFRKQKKKAKPCNSEGAPKSRLKSVRFSPDLLIMNPEQDEMEKQQGFSSFKGHLEICGPQKPSESCLVVSSPSAPMASQEIDQEQQLEHPGTIVENLQTPINGDHAYQRQQLDLLGLKMALEKILSAVEELTTPVDITNSEKVEHEELLDHQISETSRNHVPELPERPPGFERIVEQLSHECPQQVILHGEAKKPVSEPEKEKQLEISIEERHLESERTMVDQVSQEQPQQVTLCHGAGDDECKLAKDQKFEISVEEMPTEVEMDAVGLPCQIKQQIQGQQLCPQGPRQSKSGSGSAAITHVEQLQNTEMLQEPKKLIVADESSQMMNQQETGSPGKKTQGEQQQRQLRPQAPRPSRSDSAHVTYANDLNQTLSTIKLEKKQKLGRPIHKRPLKQRQKKVDKLSQSDELEVDHLGKQKRHRSQLAPITSDEAQIIENPAEFKPSVAEDLVQTPQQQKSQKWELQPQIQCSSQAEQSADKIMAEPSLHHTEQQDQLRLRRGRPSKLNSDVNGAGRDFSPVNTENHCKKQPSLSKCRGRPPKANASTQLNVREPPSDHQSIDKQQPQKRGRGRPPKSMLATHKIVVSLSAQHQSKQQDRQGLGQHRGSFPESKPDSAETKVTFLPSKHNHQEQQQELHGAGLGRITRARAAATAAIIS